MYYFIKLTLKFFNIQYSNLLVNFSKLTQTNLFNYANLFSYRQSQISKNGKVNVFLS